MSRRESATLNSSVSMVVLCCRRFCVLLLLCVFGSFCSIPLISPPQSTPPPKHTSRIQQVHPASVVRNQKVLLVLLLKTCLRVADLSGWVADFGQWPNQNLVCVENHSRWVNVAYVIQIEWQIHATPPLWSLWSSWSSAVLSKKNQSRSNHHLQLPKKLQLFDLRSLL